MQRVNFCNSEESSIYCLKPTLDLRQNNRIIWLALLLISVNFSYAQDATIKHDKAILINLAPPILGQLEIGLFVEGKSNFDYLVYGRYNFNRVPDALKYPYIYGANAYIDHNYDYWSATESGYTIGGQIRYKIKSKIRSNQIEYYKYLDSKNLKSGSYFGGWLEFGNSISTDLPNLVYNFDSTKSTLVWNNVSGGLLFGVKGNIGKSLMWDTYAGLGANNYNAQLSFTDNLSGSPKNADFQETGIAGKIGIQLGYKF